MRYHSASYKFNGIFLMNPLWRKRNERIANLVEAKTRATADDFLRGIAYNYVM